MHTRMLHSNQDSIPDLSQEATLAGIMACYREFDAIADHSHSCPKSVKLVKRFLSDPDIRAFCESQPRSKK